MKVAGRIVRPLTLGVPPLVLVGAYVWLAFEHGTPALWSTVVHESGRYTLAETVFYWSHFLREVPTVLAYALFLLMLASPARAGTLGRRPALAAMALALAALLIVVAWLTAASTTDAHTALRDLLQYRTRDDLSEYGSHWRFHWLSTLWFGAATTWLASVRAGHGAPWFSWSPARAALAWGWFLGLTFVFGLSAEVFVDVRYTGHQAREIMTHGPTTLLAGAAILLYLGRRPDLETDRRPPQWAVRGAAAAGLAIPAYLALVSLSGGVMEHGQADLGLAAMVAAHYFEHALDYLLVFLLLLGGVACLTPLAPHRSSPANPPDR